MMKHTRGYNELKWLALSIFEKAKNEGQVWLSPPEWAVLAGFFPIRAAYSYLRHLRRWGLLVERRRGRQGRLNYALSKRGQERLEWLRQQGVGGWPGATISFRAAARLRPGCPSKRLRLVQ